MIDINEQKIELPFNEVNEYSEEFTELYKKQPKWIVRWGIIVISFCCLLFVFLSFYIKYPDVVIGTAQITSNNPPAIVVVRTNGLLSDLEVNNDTMVKKGTIIAYIKNTTELASYRKLKTLLQNLPSTQLNEYKNLQLGELQQYYNDFLWELKNVALKRGLAEHNSRSAEINADISAVGRTLEKKNAKVNLYKTELALIKKDYERTEKLLSKGVISNKEFDQKEQEYLGAKRTLEDMELSIIDSRKELNELKHTQNTLDITSEESIDMLSETLRSKQKILEERIKDWEYKYLLVAPVDGRINYVSKDVFENSNLEAGEAVFSITPVEKGSLKVNIQAPARKSGKLKKGQRVNIYLDNYPSEEYGILEGKVSKLSFIPNEEGFYLIEASLPQKMVTSYGIKLGYQPNLIGSAEIITEDVSLFKRMFYEFYRASRINQ